MLNYHNKNQNMFPEEECYILVFIAMYVFFYSNILLCRISLLSGKTETYIQR